MPQRAHGHAAAKVEILPPVFIVKPNALAARRCQRQASVIRHGVAREEFLRGNGGRFGDHGDGGVHLCS